jgi:hypothetical protein
MLSKYNPALINQYVHCNGGHCSFTAFDKPPTYMKKNFLLNTVPILGLCLVLAACGDSGDNAQSAPIDSTNQSGIAPAQPVEGTPGSTIDPTVQARDQYQQDTLGDRSGTPPPVGNGTNTSNTSDARTTTGSSNNGDADGDRKK